MMQLRMKKYNFNKKQMQLNFNILQNLKALGQQRILMVLIGKDKVHLTNNFS